MKGKPLVLEFFDFVQGNKPETNGLKFVLFKVADLDGKLIGYDFGFSEYGEKGFEVLVTKTQSAIPVQWAEIPNPKLLF